MAKSRCANIRVLHALTLGLGSMAALLPACASDQKSSVTAEEVRDGEAIPPAPPAPPPAAPEAPAAAPTAAAGTGNAPAPSEAPAEALTESQMAKVTELINTGEIEQAKVAQRRAKAPGVKQFAERMIKHHEQARREQTKIVQRLKLTPADSTTAAKVKTDGEAQLTKLKDIDAAGFDAVYISSQITAHQQALDLLDTQLIPNAKTPDVVSALQTARAMVQQHLQDARALSP